MTDLLIITVLIALIAFGVECVTHEISYRRRKQRAQQIIRRVAE